ncbi:hypothetical protein DCCM_2998 [Desulfocucumis palustris]|uniref:Uncharacterized protein n=1 Tax=Desulfocucumis palustris TaxID=1898651 RepID=A0A2L2XC31_9FIRM|nr:hypothetical protein DCCM_2998 [Desulfocucumis palustris]
MNTTAPMPVLHKKSSLAAAFQTPLHAFQSQKSRPKQKTSCYILINRRPYTSNV